MNNENEGRIDLSKIEQKYHIEKLTEKDLAKMTYSILAGLGVIFVFSSVAYIFTKEVPEEILKQIRDYCGIMQNSETSAKETLKFCESVSLSTKNLVNKAAKEVFEFCKTFIPPIITLVLGVHYVTKKNET